ncbi:hypothetical protein C0992_006335 [Termitomyces sp. T32_za158]|nr:hypothetical protein C0992_006335 [Termitomyces sp. T32_za158]
MKGMPPCLRVLAGTGTTLTSITHLVNTTNAFPLVSDRFEGELVVCIKGFNHPEKDAYDYFERPERRGITWSIQVRGSFLEHILADNVLFGNTFDRPLGLPWGSGAALRFMSYVDPTLEHDLTSRTHPWALSPLIATMPHLAHTRIARNNHLASLPAHEETTEATESLLSSFPPKTPVFDDTSQLHLAHTGASSSSSSGSSSHSSISSFSSTASIPPLSPYVTASDSRPQQSRSTIKAEKVNGEKKGKEKLRTGLGLTGASQRRAYFASAAHRQDIMFGPEVRLLNAVYILTSDKKIQDVLTTDFCYGFLEFSPSLALRLPGGLSFDLTRYWDGQPVRFVCCERKRREGAQGDNKLPWGQVFWSVVIEMADAEAITH